MAHELTTRENGFTEMAYLYGTDRWHGLGNLLNPNSTIDEWITAAGMDWKVQRSKVRYITARGEGSPSTTQEWPDQHVLFRSDTKAPLGIVSDGFKIVQPKQTLEFFRDLCADNHFTLRTAGTLFGGKRFWALADIGAEAFVLNPADKVRGRLLLVTACDGSLKTTAKFVSECVVCNNTLTMALGEDGSKVAVSHRSTFDASLVKQRLGVAQDSFAKFITNARMLSDKKVSDATADYMTLNLVVPQEKLDEASRGNAVDLNEYRAKRDFKRIMELFTTDGKARNMFGRKGTVWGWLNAVTEYADHHTAARNVDNRFNTSQFGAGDMLKNDALKIALAYAA